MSVLNAFLSTWSNARQTFGEGTPQAGAQYDNSGALRQAQSTVESAAPGSRWTGGAATAYGSANMEHGRVIGQLAGLDQRLSAHVDQSAEVVAAGRRNLDAVRQWVVDAAASVPPGQAGETMKMAIVQKGISQVQEIIQRSNGELNSIGGKIRDLGGEYQALGEQKFAKEGPQLLGAEGKEDNEEEKRRQAEKDVHDALAGDPDAAKRVEEVLGRIQPGQQLKPDEASYLSQMQAQQ
ncbi:MAG: EspA/EspE family type VII secretion system effector, partial [Mycobacterium sp.]|uniref:EspA/EspE family type VII secretion system effector n=1 Tax=Mycobacterium sp. TaxID=1785 RepID=UPI00389AF74E